MGDLMASWWELVIPAASTLLGGFSGAWWQSRSSLRLITKQADIMAKAHLEEERQSRYMRLFDLRREAYNNLIDAAAIYEKNARSRRLKDGNIAGPPSGPDKELRQCGADLRRAVEAISLLAPREVIYAASALESVTRETSKPGFSSRKDGRYYRLARGRFIEHARADLGVPPDEQAALAEEAWRKIPTADARAKARKARLAESSTVSTHQSHCGPT
jgi:hypothetical protein